MPIFRYMKNRSITIPQAAENQSVTLSSENQSVNAPAYDSTYFSTQFGGFITTRALKADGMLKRTERGTYTITRKGEKQLAYYQA